MGRGNVGTKGRKGPVRLKKIRNLKGMAVVPEPGSVPHSRDLMVPPAPDSYRIDMISTKNGQVKVGCCPNPVSLVLNRFWINLSPATKEFGFGQ